MCLLLQPPGVRHIEKQQIALEYIADRFPRGIQNPEYLPEAVSYRNGFGVDRLAASRCPSRWREEVGGYSIGGQQSAPKATLAYDLEY